MKIEPPPEYIKQIQSMAERAKQWINEHPEANPMLSFPPKTVMFIGAVTGPALSIIAKNQDAVDLLKYMVEPWEMLPEQSTVLMTMTALDAVFPT